LALRRHLDPEPLSGAILDKCFAGKRLNLLFSTPGARNGQSISLMMRQLDRGRGPHKRHANDPSGRRSTNAKSD